MPILRNAPYYEAVTVATTAGGSASISLDSSAGGMVRVASGSTASLTFYVSGDGENFYQVENADGDVSLTVSAKWINLPDEVYAAKYLKMVGDAAGTVDVLLKS